MKVSEVAKAAGVKTETIRFYQNKGLIPIPQKPASGFHSYPKDTVDKILFIKRAKKLGLSLDEILNLINNDHSCREVKSLAETKLAQVVLKMDELKLVEVELNTLINACKIYNDDCGPTLCELSFFKDLKEPA